MDFDGSICGGGRGEPEVLIQNFLLLKRESQGFRFHLYNLEAGNFFDRLRCQNLRCRKSDAIKNMGYRQDMTVPEVAKKERKKYLDFHIRQDGRGL